MSDQSGDNSDDDSSSAGGKDIQPNAISSTYKVRGEDELSDGAGVLGHNTATTGTAMGVEGVTESDAGTGVRGTTTASSGLVFGVHGSGTSPSAYGVLGTVVSGIFPFFQSGKPMGVRGYTDRSGAQNGVEAGYGVFGSVVATSGEAYGVYGFTNSSDGYGVYSDGDSKTTGKHRIDGRLDRGTVGASVGLDNEQSVPGSDETRVAYDKIEFDDGAWDSTNNEYVVPMDGTYRLDAHVSFDDSFSENTFVSLHIHHFDNGIEQEAINHQELTPASGGSSGYAAQLSRTVRATKDDTFYVTVYQTDGEQTLEGLPYRNCFDVTQIG